MQKGVDGFTTGALTDRISSFGVRSSEIVRELLGNGIPNGSHTLGPRVWGTEHMEFSGSGKD